MRYFKRTEGIYLLLVIVTLVLCLWQLLGMNRRLVMFPEPARSPYEYNDSINGGRSIGTLRTTSQGLTLDCQTRRSHTFAFCGLVIPTGESATQGVDLRGYDQLHLWLNYQSEQKDTLLVYLQNHQPASASRQQRKQISLYPVVPSPGMTHYQLALDRFFVPSWWLMAFASDTQDAEPARNNVTGIQLATGDNTAERQLEISVQRIELHGKWISAQTLYGSLLLAWIGVMVLHGVVRLVSLSRANRDSQRRARELEKLNQLLCIEKDQFESMAKHDALTGLLNRAGLRDSLAVMQQAYFQHQQPCSAILLDIDHFKSINDTRGHDVGDQVIRLLGQTVKSHLRANDCVARWGGEEFVILCAATTQDQAAQIAEKLRRVVNQSAHINLPRFTCSFGVAEYRGTEIEGWFKQADQALYRAKQQGRNLVCAA